MTNPEFLLLDEPAEGLAPLFVTIVEEQISRLREKGLTVLLAEQNLRFALKLSDRGYIIDNGVIRYQGSIKDLRENEEVRKNTCSFKSFLFRKKWKRPSFFTSIRKFTLKFRLHGRYSPLLNLTIIPHEEM